MQCVVLQFARFCCMHLVVSCCCVILCYVMLCYVMSCHVMVCYVTLQINRICFNIGYEVFEGTKKQHVHSENRGKTTSNTIHDVFQRLMTEHFSLSLNFFTRVGGDGLPLLILVSGKLVLSRFDIKLGVSCRRNCRGVPYMACF